MNLGPSSAANSVVAEALQRAQVNWNLLSVVCADSSIYGMEKKDSTLIVHIIS